MAKEKVLKLTNEQLQKIVDNFPYYPAEYIPNGYLKQVFIFCPDFATAFIELRYDIKELKFEIPLSSIHRLSDFKEDIKDLKQSQDWLTEKLKLALTLGFENPGLRLSDGASVAWKDVAFALAEEFGIPKSKVEAAADKVKKTYKKLEQVKP